jgi:hypothetical protein
MKKATSNLIVLVLILFISLILILSTIGIETNKFNKLIINKVYQNKSIDLTLNTIKFKIDPKKLNLFLETQNPEIIYKEIFLPVRNIKVYINFLSLIKAEPKIEKTSLILEEIDITQINKLSAIVKPSNFKSILNNNIKKGRLITEIEIFLTEQGDFKNFIAKGSVKNLEMKLFNELYFKEGNLSFFADKNDILIKNIFGTLEDIKILEGDIKLNIEKNIKLTSNFNSIFDLDEKLVNKYSKYLNNFNFTKSIKNIKGDFNNSFSIILDNTYKVKNYNYSFLGTIKNSKIELLKPLKNEFITEELKTIYFEDLKINSRLAPKEFILNTEGKYSFNNLDFLKINLSNTFVSDISYLKLNFDYMNSFKLGLINYQKPKKSIANLYLDFEMKKDNIKINNLNYDEGKNSIKINGLRLKKNKFLSFQEIKVDTENNNFVIQNDKKINIKGDKFDATNLAKFLNNQDSKNNFKNLIGDIKVEFKEIKAPMSEKIKNFRLIGEIQQGKFVKISSKGDFGGDNFLDISMKQDKDGGKKYLEIYSDLTRPLLTEYRFFKGLSGGKLFFTSIIEDSRSNSKLKIENFKIVNAPGLIKLLSLADLGGLADLAEGEGLSFDVLEINMEKNKSFLKLNEVLALGPSMSVLMEGYQDENGLTSLKGTLVPAKTLNKMISKIPVIGNIVIPKEVGEGLFGVSFKMKGPKGNIKTTINPIKTLTPRFIQKIIERNKN